MLSLYIYIYICIYIYAHCNGSRKNAEAGGINKDGKEQWREECKKARKKQQKQISAGANYMYRVKNVSYPWC
jgi:hypothetical protein